MNSLLSATSCVRRLTHVLSVHFSKPSIMFSLCQLRQSRALADRISRSRSHVSKHLSKQLPVKLFLTPMNADTELQLHELV